MNADVDWPGSPSEDLPCEETRQEFARALARMAKALAHPARVEIVRFLLEGGECMCGDIVGRLPLVQSTVSEHLKQLREAGLISGRREQCCMVYCANPAAFEHLRLLVGRLVGAQARTASE